MKQTQDKKAAPTGTSAEPAATTNGQARGPRSPNFPSIPLAEAIGKVRTLYDQDKRNAVSLNTVLTHLGFGAKLSGTTARVLSALRQFGLLDQVGTGAAPQFKVTELAFRIIALSEGSPDRLKAVQDSVKKPAVYREILAHFSDGLPSDPALSDYLLLEKKFNEGSIETFIRVFRASIGFANLQPIAYTTGRAETDQDNGGGEAELETHPPETENTQTVPPRQREVEVARAGIAREVFALEQGEAVLQWPTSLNTESVSELEDWLALVVKKLKRLTKKPVAPEVNT